MAERNDVSKGIEGGQCRHLGECREVGVNDCTLIMRVVLQSRLGYKENQRTCASLVSGDQLAGLEQGITTNVGVSKRNVVPKSDPSWAGSSLLPGPAWRERVRGPGWRA